MASVPYVRRQRDATALGAQQAQRLQQLRLVSERHVQEEHLQVSRGAGASLEPSGEACKVALSPVFPHSSRASRTVEAVIESRAVEDVDMSKAVRLRKTIRDARGGIQTERSAEDRPRTMAEPARVEPTTGRPATYAPGIHHKIGAVRRRYPLGMKSSTSRKLTRDELEWIEKQLQFTQRIALVEKECIGWWQNFYASAGVTTGAASAIETAMTALSIQKQIDDCDERRQKDAEEMIQQLNGLRGNADNVIRMVHAMRDGTQFVAELQDAMDAFETALGAFRVGQREKFDAYVLEEKLLDRDLSAFVQKIEVWEAEDAEKKLRKNKVKPIKRTGVAVQTAVSTEDIGDDNIHTSKKGESQTLDEDAETLDQKGQVDLVKRVRQLNNQILESGGLKGGWDDREHAVFASTLLKCGLTDDVIIAHQVAQYPSNQEDRSNAIDFESAVGKFMRKCITAVVTKSENAVRNHFDWYVSHVLLVQEKKEVIQQWKQHKEAERQQLIRQGLHQVQTDKDDAPQDTVGSGDGLGPNGREATEEEKSRRNEQAARDRTRKNQQLEAWREEKERKAAEKLEAENEMRMRTEALEAKKRQELLGKKQQILLYKLQKEEEATALQRDQGSNAFGSRSPQSGNDEALLERSRKAIEMAKAKRAQLQAIEERRLKQQTLPDRPKSVTKRQTSASGSKASSPTDYEGSPSTRETTLLKPTKAYEARQLTNVQLKRKEKERSKQGAHDTYFPGANVVSDVKIKSFGHIAIAPRAVPTWRRNL